MLVAALGNCCSCVFVSKVRGCSICDSCFAKCSICYVMAAIRVGILTISDSCDSGDADDVSGATLSGLVYADGLQLSLKSIVCDDVTAIQVRNFDIYN